MAEIKSYIIIKLLFKKKQKISVYPDYRIWNGVENVIKNNLDYWESDYPFIFYGEIRVSFLLLENPEKFNKL